ncbi:GntR family transcriptional regulator [Pantoea allii]|uniref:GntR family transcriptional regulator n=1 Tax=Pantoea allii TaxID=574096 RepID=A0A2V2BNY3_9GAMM|nr:MULTISPECIES: GntR family transcriptional regulator [Pantoea]MDJ0088366.1 GntR family transcriptional regulator [Pantoea allii]NQS85540.1 GntR family transcriptional regulator [Pantoea allii]OAE08853.1 GntR family transcriptional regulator [Pantoea sp. OXWO6B1]PWL01030.1 GntR family transcriptional regulator [Pantoea allii]
MIYKFIADKLRLRLNSPYVAVGSAIPAEKVLATEFGVARMTLRKAIDLLVSEGLLERRHGSGTYVSGKDICHETSSLTGLAEVLRLQGKEVISKVLAFELIAAPPAVASQLRINSGERLFFSRRLRYVDEKLLMLEESYMPVKTFPDLTLAHLEKSKFDYIEQECGIVLEGNYESLSPVLSDKRLSHLMNIAEKTLLLRVDSLSYSNTGAFINYAVMYRNTYDYQVNYHLRRTGLSD